MLKDARDVRPQGVISADVCVAGAGAAGITIARGLRGSGSRVVVLEGGGMAYSSEVQALYAGKSTGALGNVDLKSTRVRAFGGTTTVWAGLCRPLQAIDFKRRDWFPHSGWPIGLEDLEPYYRQAAETLDLGAHEWMAEAVAGRNGQTLIDFGDSPVRTVLYQFSPPTRFGEKYREDLESAPDIDVYLNANLVEIGLAGGGDAIGSFQCRTLDGARFRVEARVYVLAMGGVENPRILLASSGASPAGLGNAHDQVGRHFMEHPRLFGAPGILVAPRDIPIESYLGPRSLEFQNAGSAQGRMAVAQFALEVEPNVREAQQLFGLSAMLSEIWNDPNSHLRGRDVASALGLTFDGSHRLFLLTLRTEQPPVPNSRVTLDAQNDALGVPRARLDWNNDERYFENIHRTLRIMGAAFARSGLGRLWIPTDDDGRFVHDFVGAHHHMGTTRMSESPEEGVVDADCRVHGIANLYVAGCSVFPTAGYNNPTFTLVALAHRLADHLRSRMGSGSA